MNKKIKKKEHAGWTVEFETIQAISAQANNMDDVSLGQTEAIVLAMVDLGYAEFEDEVEK